MSQVITGGYRTPPGYLENDRYPRVARRRATRGYFIKDKEAKSHPSLLWVELRVIRMISRSRFARLRGGRGFVT